MNGDPTLAVFGKGITPTSTYRDHLVTLDHFLDTGDASMDGWGWSLQGRATSTLSLTQNINYAGVDRRSSYISRAQPQRRPAFTVAQRVIFGSLYTDSLADTARRFQHRSVARIERHRGQRCAVRTGQGLHFRRRKQRAEHCATTAS